ncbi:MAG: GGDEF domain-containing protein [Lachnospiraceae bacterium]|nr:GGDEF domain-containing protein [Lachnospiraceae bacterium]
MEARGVNTYTLEEAIDLFSGNVDVIIIVNNDKGRYYAVKRTGFFLDFIDEEGEYKELIETLWFHFNNTREKIIKDYQVFLPTFGKFKGKYSKKMKLLLEGEEQPRVVQITVYPVGDEKYLFLLDELDNSEYLREFMTESKVKTIQSTYLFSMYFDLVQNTTSSISITEISDEATHTSLSYTEWRMMIVNMFRKDDQKLFLERTHPDYLRKNFKPGDTSSFDCLMMNLEGVYIWVKLIFSRASTTNEDDFRFVFMVQNIHENIVELQNELKKYEELVSMDALTQLFNHGRMETEIMNALDYRKKQNGTVSAMILDIDFFKNVNDSYGHSVGDKTLKHFARILKDVAGENKVTTGRWGGEEFVIVCYDRDGDGIREKAEEICQTVREREFPVIGHLTCSIGTTQLLEEDDSQSVFDRMDRALYMAKSQGRNRVVML